MTSDHLVRLEQLATLLEIKLNQDTTLDLQIQRHTEIIEIEDTITEASDANDIIFLNNDTIRRRVRSENALDNLGGGEPSTSSSGSAAIRRHVASAKLPKLNLPTLKCDYENCLSFYDLFKASVHANRSLPDSQRLQYLKGSLQGYAAKLLTSLAKTDANYSIVLQTFEERYANPRIIARTHLTSIFDYPNVKWESSKDLRKLIETLEQHRLRLENLGQPVNQFHLVIVFIVSNKLDSETRKQWELSDPGTDFQTYQQLKTFVESRCQALEAAVVNVTKHKDLEVKGNHRDPRSFAQTYATHWKKDPCSACDANDHKLYGCPKFENNVSTEKSE